MNTWVHQSEATITGFISQIREASWRECKASSQVPTCWRRRRRRRDHGGRRGWRGRRPAYAPRRRGQRRSGGDCRRRRRCLGRRGRRRGSGQCGRGRAAATLRMQRNSVSERGRRSVNVIAWHLNLGTSIRDKKFRAAEMVVVRIGGHWLLHIQTDNLFYRDVESDHVTDLTKLWTSCLEKPILPSSSIIWPSDFRLLALLQENRPEMYRNFCENFAAIYRNMGKLLSVKICINFPVTRANLRRLNARH